MHTTFSLRAPSIKSPPTILLVVTILLMGCGEKRGAQEEATTRDAWVTVDRLNRRTCPNASCGIVGQLSFREKATIHQDSAGWARITRYYDAFCHNGESEYVDSGNATCEAANGIVDGRLAEWVSLQYLSSDRPADPARGATGYRALVSGSDDYRRYAETFATTAADLIESGECTRADFEEMGGWLKSEINYPNQPVYFAYCGGLTREDRLYLNAETGEVFR